MTTTKCRSHILLNFKLHTILFNNNSYTQINITVAKLLSGEKKKKSLGYFTDPSKLTQPDFPKGRKSVS